MLSPDGIPLEQQICRDDLLIFRGFSRDRGRGTPVAHSDPGNFPADAGDCPHSADNSQCPRLCEAAKEDEGIESACATDEWMRFIEGFEGRTRTLDARARPSTFDLRRLRLMTAFDAFGVLRHFARERDS